MKKSMRVYSVFVLDAEKTRRDTLEEVFLKNKRRYIADCGRFDVNIARVRTASELAKKVFNDSQCFYVLVSNRFDKNAMLELTLSLAERFTSISFKVVGINIDEYQKTFSFVGK